MFFCLLLKVDFIDKIENTEISNQLERLIQGKGAFRRFKDYCIEIGIIQKWYDYKNERYKEIAIKCCESNGIEYDNK